MGPEPVPVEQFRPEVGNPQLYDIAVYPSWITFGFHLDMEATIADFLRPQGQTVKFYWLRDLDKAP